jgi:hypothetical protein
MMVLSNISTKFVSVMFLLICLCGHNAFASNAPAIECVNSQAAKLGHYSNPNKTEFSDDTVEASRLMAIQFEALQDLRQITQDNAIAWCRELGLADETLKEFWPTKTGPKFEYIFSKSLNSGQQLVIQNAILFAFTYFKSLDVELAGTVKVIASSDLTELSQNLIDNSQYTISRAKAASIINRQCRGRGLGGFNAPGMIIICFNPRYNWRQAQVNLRMLLAHELSHEIQRQMTGYRPIGIESEDEYLNEVGPLWLVEGSAIAFQFKALLPYVDVNEHISVFRSDVGGYSGEKLAQLTYSDATLDRNFPNYAALAGHLLASRNDGHRGFLNYWKLLARENWQSAFTTAFGISPDDFYREFQ